MEINNCDLANAEGMAFVGRGLKFYGNSCFRYPLPISGEQKGIDVNLADRVNSRKKAGAWRAVFVEKI